MRYTEEDYNIEIVTIGDLARYLFVSIVQAPMRLMGEISIKVMYLKRNVLEKLLLGTMSICVGLLVIDLIIFVIWGKINLFDGYLPIVVKVIVLLMCVGLSLYLGNKVSLAEELREVYATTRVTEEVTTTESVKDMVSRIYDVSPESMDDDSKLEEEEDEESLQFDEDKEELLFEDTEDEEFPIGIIEEEVLGEQLTQQDFEDLVIVDEEDFGELVVTNSEEHEKKTQALNDDDDLDFGNLITDEDLELPDLNWDDDLELGHSEINKGNDDIDLGESDSEPEVNSDFMVDMLGVIKKEV